MTPEEQTELEKAMATRASQMMISTLDAAGVPRNVQLEAVFVTLGALIVRNLKPENALMVYNAGSMRLRERIKELLKGGKKNARH